MIADNVLAVVVYGIGRGGELCERAFEENVLDWAPVGYKTHVLEIRDNVDYIDNSRSGEKGAVNVDSFFFEFSDKYKINAFNSDVELAWINSCAYADVHQDLYASNKNLLKQLSLLKYSLKKITQLPKVPKYVVCSRDDILWTSPIDLSLVFEFLKRRPNSYFTSCYYWNGGVAERFFIADIQVAALVMSRLDYIEEYYADMESLRYVKKKGLNAEWFTRYVLEKFGIDVVSMPIITPRVRIGARVKKDNLFPRPWRLSCFGRSQAARLRFLNWRLSNWR